MSAVWPIFCARSGEVVKREGRREERPIRSPGEARDLVNQRGFAMIAGAQPIGLKTYGATVNVLAEERQTPPNIVHKVT
jgi:hypothetical protein